MNIPTPYVSVVVAARNDDHGGNLLGRMQAFVNGWIGQVKRHGVASELIIVEWNPPVDRQPLAEVLKWPMDLEPGTIRIVRVPSSIHQRYRHAEALALYQMIAKNVGIRRARGRFVLATNIDILFSDELMSCLAGERLEPGRMYRIDRHDVMGDVPIHASVDEQLSYCRTHLIRINARDGTHKLTAEGLRALETEDVAAADSGLNFGPGWFPVERGSLGEVFRWAEGSAELTIRYPPGPPALLFDVEPGPGVSYGPFRIQLLDECDRVLTEGIISQRSTIELYFPRSENGTRRLRLNTVAGGQRIPYDPRVLNFRIFRCSWGETRHTRTPPGTTYRMLVTPKQHGRFLSLQKTIRKALRFYADAKSIPVACLAVVRYILRSRLLPKLAEGQDIFEGSSCIRPGRGWYPLERYFGETFRWVSKDAELVIHSAKAGLRTLVLDIESGPGVKYKPFELLVCNRDKEVLARAQVKRMERIEVPIPVVAGRDQAFVLTLDGGGAPAGDDPRILNFRVFSCRWSMPEEVDISDEPELTTVESHPDIGPILLHTNGCGDFTLMAREHWLDLRGYPEFDMFSMHLDSVLCCAAHHAGFREEILREPLRIYHIEHLTGSGWTPEGQDKLFASVTARGIPIINYHEVVRWAAQMRRFNRPMIFNLDNWGLADAQLEESVIGGHARVRAVG